MRNAIKNETKNVNKNSLFCSIGNIFDLLNSRTNNLRTDTSLSDGCDTSIFANKLISQILSNGSMLDVTAYTDNQYYYRFCKKSSYQQKCIIRQ